MVERGGRVVVIYELHDEDDDMILGIFSFVYLLHIRLCWYTEGSGPVIIRSTELLLRFLGR